jgi:hypothetical protein
MGGKMANGRQRGDRWPDDVKSAETRAAVPHQKVDKPPKTATTTSAPKQDPQSPSLQERMVTALIVGALGSGAVIVFNLAFSRFRVHGLEHLMILILLCGPFWLIAGAISGMRRDGIIGIIIGGSTVP